MRIFAPNFNGAYYFTYPMDDGIVYKNENGKISKTEFYISNVYGSEITAFSSISYVGFDNLELYSSDKEHSFYSSYNYEYVVIDGNRFSKSPALHAWYDKDKNAFIWNAVEGKELVVYEYKLP